MAKIIATAQVEDSSKWLEGFVTHRDLFEEMTVTSVDYAVTPENEITLCFEVNDVDKYLEINASQATADAMEFDGVKRETVKVVVLDTELRI